jgi:hypothetical protein
MELWNILKYWILGCNWLHSGWTKSLVCKDAFNRDFTIQSTYRRLCIACKSEEFRFPVSRPDDHAILSGCPSVHCSIRPDDVPYRPDSRQTKHHPSGRRVFPSRPFIVSTNFCSSLHPFGLLSNPSGRPLVFDQASDSSQNYIWEDCCNRPDDVDFHPDALLLKARIAIQIQPSERLSAWSGRAFNRYGNYGFDFNCPDACLSWSERAHSKYGNCVLKINRPDGHPPWSERAKPYMEITCSGRATVRTRLSNKKDFQPKSQKFWSHSCLSGRPMSTIRMKPIYFIAVTHLNLSL